MTNVFIYSRVSTDEQADGCSLDVQEQRLTTYCASKGYTIIEPIQDDYSAKDYNLVRPGLKKIYDYCKKHRGEVDKVLFLRWDRFTRNVEFAMTYKRKFYDEMGIEINAIENPIDFNTPEWATLFPLYCGVAHTEDEKISRRTKDGIHGTLLKGKSSGRVPRGYKNVRISKHDCWVEVDTKEAEKVKALFTEVAKGVEAPTLIKRRLYPSLADSTFFHTLRNRFYTGYLHVPAYNDEPEQYVKGVHEALIDEDTFNAVQAIIDGDKKKQPKLTKAVIPEFYLRKFLVCPVCGHVLTGAFSRGNGGRYAYYFCNDEHKHLNVRAEKVNEGFAKFVSTLKPNKAILALYKEILNDVRGENLRGLETKAAKLQKEADAITERIHKVQDLYFDGEITKEEKLAAIERYTKEQTKLNNQIASIRLGTDKQMKKKLEYSINLISNIGDFFRYAAPEVKIKLLGSMFPEKIEFDGEKYRTTAINETLHLIFKETKQLQGKKNENDCKNRSHRNLGCDVGLEPTTPRTTIWCSTN